MDFAILGPLQVHVSGRPVRLAAKPRAVLGALLLHPGVAVSRDRLITSVWDDPPRSAPSNLQTYVSLLRRTGIPVETQGQAYRLSPDPARLDLLVFADTVRQARRDAAHGDTTEAHRLFEAAFSLWRGRPAEDVPLSGAAAPRIAELDEQGESARLDWIDLRLRLGLYGELIGELTSLVEAVPLKERLWHRLMVALHRAGRRAEALDAYRRARAVLVAELGVEPGQELRSLHAAILDGASLEAPGQEPLVRAPAGHETYGRETYGHETYGRGTHEQTEPERPAPDKGAHQRDTHEGGVHELTTHERGGHEREAPSWRGVCLLPADIAGFVGRRQETQTVLDMLGHTGRRSGPRHAGQRSGPRSAAPAIVVVSGPPGVGKTTLAVHLAHLARGLYPDGQLFVRLDGASASPRDPADLLAELLRALGVDGCSMPASTEERAAMYRARIADRQVLVLLDDAGGEDQVHPLLPGTSGSAVVVTSRGPLPTLAGATALTLDVPPFQDARDLLAEVAGTARVESDPESAEAILRACGRLPLALRIAGARLVTRPAWPLAEFARRLRDASAPLDELQSGRLDVRTAFAMSYATLSPEAQGAFRTFGFISADSMAAWCVGALLGVPAGVADRALEELAAAGLLTGNVTDGAAQLRYRMHDLLRSFASELSAEESEEQRSAALGRLADEARSRVVGASRELPHAFAPPPADAPPRTPPSAGGCAWLPAEREVLVAVVEAAARAGLVSASAELAYALAPFLTVRGFHDDAVRMLEAVIRAARRADDTPVEARMRLVRGDVEVDRGRSLDVASEFRALLTLLEETGDQHAAAYALAGVATCRTMAGELRLALDDAVRAAGRFLRAGDAGGLLSVWLVTAGIQLHLGAYDDAVETCRRALALVDGGRNGIRCASFLRALGIACYETGRVGEAIGHYRASLVLSRELRWNKGERTALRRLGEANAALGRFDHAARMLDECREMFARAGDTQGAALTAFALGELRRWQGDEYGALECFTTCYTLLGPHSEQAWLVRTQREITRSLAALRLARSLRA